MAAVPPPAAGYPRVTGERFRDGASSRTASLATRKPSLARPISRRQSSRIFPPRHFVLHRPRRDTPAVQLRHTTRIRAQRIRVRSPVVGRNITATVPRQILAQHHPPTRAPACPPSSPGFGCRWLRRLPGTRLLRGGLGQQQHRCLLACCPLWWCSAVGPGTGTRTVSCHHLLAARVPVVDDWWWRSRPCACLCVLPPRRAVCPRARCFRACYRALDEPLVEAVGYYEGGACYDYYSQYGDDGEGEAL